MAAEMIFHGSHWLSDYFGEKLFSVPTRIKEYLEVLCYVVC